MRVVRWPALVLIPLLVVAAGVVGRDQGGSSDQAAPGLADLAMPTVSPASASGATWYCAGGTVDEDDAAPAQEHLVVVSNTSDQPRSVRLTAYPSGAQPTETSFELPGRTRSDVALQDVLPAGTVSAHIAALVEVSGGGGVAVQQEMTGSAGASLSPCASAPSSSWYFPAGTTRAGSQFVLSLFNPFPTDAVVDITFDADDGTRSPEAFQGLVVPAGSVTPVDVGAVVTLRQELATSVTVRSGRLVVDQLQVADGLSLVLGGVIPQGIWFFPDGAAGGGSEAIVLYNPGPDGAEVAVQVLLDDPDVNGVAEPFQVSVGPGRYEVVQVLADGRVPAGVGHSTIVRSTNGVGVVAERSVTGAEEGDGRLALTIGAPAAATRWVAASAGLEGTEAASVAIMNPFADGDATVRVVLVGEGTASRVEKLTIAPGDRRVVQLPLGPGGSNPGVMLVVDGDRPVVVESRFAFEDDASYAIAAPVLDTMITPSLESLFVPFVSLDGS